MHKTQILISFQHVIGHIKLSGNMPFKKKGKYYYSPSGKKMTLKQVRAYYARKRNG